MRIDSDWIVIVDYNLTRVDDVQLMVDHAREKQSGGLRRGPASSAP